MIHTKEPWSVFEDLEDLHINQAKGAGFVGSIHIYQHRADQCKENARRIVACVNACEGLPTELIEKHGVTRSGIAKGAEELTKQRDALLHDAQRALEAWDCTVLHKPSDGMMQERMEYLRTTIASVKGLP